MWTWRRPGPGMAVRGVRSRDLHLDGPTPHASGTIRATQACPWSSEAAGSASGDEDEGQGFEKGRRRAGRARLPPGWCGGAVGARPRVVVSRGVVQVWRSGAAAAGETAQQKRKMSESGPKPLGEAVEPRLDLRPLAREGQPDEVVAALGVEVDAHISAVSRRAGEGRRVTGDATGGDHLGAARGRTLAGDRPRTR